MAVRRCPWLHFIHAGGLNVCSVYTEPTSLWSENSRGSAPDDKLVNGLSSGKAYTLEAGRDMSLLIIFNNSVEPLLV